jgi:glycosyltransferase involved in cell wall biosynthesis
MENEIPKVSVIIGTRNREMLFPRAVDSALHQRGVDIEVVLIDDASTDATREKAIRLYGDRIKYHRLESRQGIAVVSNIGFSHSRGEYLALIGDDDEWTDHDKISEQVKLFRQNSRLGVVGTWWRVLDGGKVVKTFSFKNPQNWVETMMVSNPLCGSSVLISRKAWIEAGGFDEKLKRGTDSDLLRRIVLAGFDATILPRITLDVYIDSPERMTPQSTVSSIEISIEAISYLIDKYNSVFSKYRKANSLRHRQLARLWRLRFDATNDPGDFQKSIKESVRAFKLSPNPYHLITHIVLMTRSLCLKIIQYLRSLYVRRRNVSC